MKLMNMDRESPEVRQLVQQLASFWSTKFAWWPVRVDPFFKVWLEHYQIRTVIHDEDHRWFRCTHWRRELGDTGEGYPEKIEEFRGGW